MRNSNHNYSKANFNRTMLAKGAFSSDKLAIFNSWEKVRMFSKKSVYAVLAAIILISGVVKSETLDEQWGLFVHYTAIHHYELAQANGQAILQSNPDAVELLALAEANPAGYVLIEKLSENEHNAELAKIASEILSLVDQGRFASRTDAKLIVKEIERLSTTDLGRTIAAKRLRNSGEYAIPYMLDAMMDRNRKDEFSNIVWALSQIGRDAIRPLVVAMDTKDVTIKAEIIGALGKIGYFQSLPYLKYVVENDDSGQLRGLAEDSIKQIDPKAAKATAAELFYQLAVSYYYRTESLVPQISSKLYNIWFWDAENKRLIRHKVDNRYFYELMAMRNCEWSVKADANYGRAIGLWVAAFFKAEEPGVRQPDYFDAGHADAMTYATTAGPEYLHHGLARAIKDKDAYVALGIVAALATTAGEKSLLYRIGKEHGAEFKGQQPLVLALAFDDRAVKYSAAIAIGVAGPVIKFSESKLVVDNLAEAIASNAANSDENFPAVMADFYAVRAAKVMLKLAETKNKVVNLSRALGTLIEATRDERDSIKVLAGKILAYLDIAAAQEAIAEMALRQEDGLEVRIAAFGSLATSAKLNASLLSDKLLDEIYVLVGDQSADAQLRSSAAAAFGSLNLPSEKAKDLILDQSKAVAN